MFFVCYLIIIVTVAVFGVYDSFKSSPVTSTFTLCVPFPSPCKLTYAETFSAVMSFRLFSEPFTITDATESLCDAAWAVNPFSRFLVAMLTFFIVFSLTSESVTFATTDFVDISFTPLGSDKLTVYSVSLSNPSTFMFTGI